jgi:purine-nucleoside phosphorylase
MPETTYEFAEQAAAFIRARCPLAPAIALVLGSGLGGLAERLTGAIAIPYAEIPHFPRSTVEGHSGRLLLGRFAGVPLAVMQGRVHCYEGYTPQQVIFPTRVLARLGIATMLVTNAAGAIRGDLAPGELVLITDHINFTGANPLSGANDERLGPRFFDMTEAYSRRLRALAQQAAAAQRFRLPEGVYLAVTGPSFETPAEIRAFRTLGADLVGMSTVHEVIAARHLGMEVLAISCVTNMAAGLVEAPIDHTAVVEIGARAEQQLARLLAALMPQLALPR